MHRAELLTRKHFSDSNEPFTLTIVGSKLYVVSDPKQTNGVYKNLKTLPFTEFVQELFKHNGVTEAGIKAAYTDLPSDKAGFPNPLGQSLGGTLVRSMHNNNCIPGRIWTSWRADFGSILKNISPFR